MAAKGTKPSSKIANLPVCNKGHEVVHDGHWSSIRKILCYPPGMLQFEILECDDEVSIASSNPEVYEELMERCGRFITHLGICRTQPEVPILPLVVKYCHDLMELCTVVASEADDKLVNHLFALNLKLKALQLSIKFKNARICLRTIAADVLEELCISSDTDFPFPPAILMSQKQIVPKANFLKKLTLHSVDGELVDLIGQKIQLEILEVTYRGISLKGDTLSPILNLKNLRELTIHAPVIVVRGIRQPRPLPLTDDFLAALSEKLQLLESLTVEASPITDRGFAHLASLPKLKNLKVDCCPKVTDKFLFLFPGLETLALSGCGIHDDGVIELLEKLQTLRELDVSATFITNKTLIAAIEETKKRSNGVRLKLHAGVTNATPDIFTKTWPLLEIVE